MKRTSYNGLIFLMLAQCMVGINIVSSKVLLTTIPVFILLTIRFTLASLILLPFHWTTPARHVSLKTHFSSLARKDWLFLIAQALCAGLLFNCLMLAGLNYTDANVAGIITSALPALIAILAWIILKEKISLQKGLCIAFATAGLVVIGMHKLHGANVTHSLLGDGIVLLALLPEAIYYVLCQCYTNRLPLFLTSALLNGINAILLLPTLFFIGWSPSSLHAVYGLLLLLIGLSTGLFYVFWFIGSQRVDSLMASLSTAIMPLATVLLAWLFLGEALSAVEFAGMGLVLLSIILYARR